jgi:hypothetical protein
MVRPAISRTGVRHDGGPAGDRYPACCSYRRALPVAVGLGLATEHALISLPAFNRLPVFEAIGAAGHAHTIGHIAGIFPRLG